MASPSDSVSSPGVLGLLGWNVPQRQAQSRDSRAGWDSPSDPHKHGLYSLPILKGPHLGDKSYGPSARPQFPVCEMGYPAPPL